MTEDEGTDDEEEDSVIYDETRRKQARKNFLIVALGLPGLALLCVSVIAFWAIGYKTPQNATFQEWFILVAASAMLIGILLFVSLAAYNVLKNRSVHTQKKLVRAHFHYREIILFNSGCRSSRNPSTFLPSIMFFTAAFGV